MIATVFGLKIGSREPVFPSDLFAEALGEIGTRLASADILLTDFLGGVARIG
jgi:hypothetical protein